MFVAEVSQASDAPADARRAAAAGTAAIAILPFADLSPERDQDYFCEGFAEELIDALTHVDRLRIAARSSSFQFRDAGVDVREVGRRFGVDALLEGSVRKSADRLRTNTSCAAVSACTACNSPTWMKVGRCSNGGAPATKTCNSPIGQVKKQWNWRRISLTWRGAARFRCFEVTMKRAHTSKRRRASMLNAVCVRAKSGMNEEALELLERVFNRGWGKRDWIDCDPDYDFLRDDPRFKSCWQRSSNRKSWNASRYQISDTWLQFVPSDPEYQGRRGLRSAPAFCLPPSRRKPTRADHTPHRAFWLNT